MGHSNVCKPMIKWDTLMWDLSYICYLLSDSIISDVVESIPLTRIIDTSYHFLETVVKRTLKNNNFTVLRKMTTKNDRISARTVQPISPKIESFHILQLPVDEPALTSITCWLNPIIYIFLSSKFRSPIKSLILVYLKNTGSSNNQI